MAQTKNKETSPVWDQLPGCVDGGGLDGTMTHLKQLCCSSVTPEGWELHFESRLKTRLLEFLMLWEGPVAPLTQTETNTNDTFPEAP